MSRVGKKPILLPENIKASREGQFLKIVGPKGELTLPVSPEIEFSLADNQIVFSVNPKQDKEILTSKRRKGIQSLWGMNRNMVENLIEGVTKGYEKRLEIEGLGYRAEVQNDDLVLSVGFSHPLRIKKIEGITFVVEKNIIVITGIRKDLVGQTAAKIRQLRAPDPYKGKGIRYLGEIIKKKAGKKAAGAVTK